MLIINSARPKTANLANYCVGNNFNPQNISYIAPVKICPCRVLEQIARFSVRHYIDVF